MNKEQSEELKAFVEKRDALFRNPTLEAATKYWNEHGFEPPVRFDVPLAMVHKGRLQWLDATDEMLEESFKWLKANGYEPTHRGAPPLTPEKRDADRVTIGKKPLNEH